MIRKSTNCTPLNRSVKSPHLTLWSDFAVTGSQWPEETVVLGVVLRFSGVLSFNMTFYFPLKKLRQNAADNEGDLNASDHGKYKNCIFYKLNIGYETVV